MRYARVPVVAAPFGLTLGGGAEVVLGCQTRAGHIELYMGLVEVGVGLIPGGGGCMEMAARVAARAPDDPAFDAAAAARAVRGHRPGQGGHQRRGGARPGLSAADDGISFAKETLIADAKQLALGLARAGYRPPPPRRIRVAGRSAAATLQTALDHLVHAHGRQRTRPEGGGQGWPSCCAAATSPAGALVSEEHLLELEREAFLSLCGEEKTQARIQHMLQTGKPLRN